MVLRSTKYFFERKKKNIPTYIKNCTFDLLIIMYIQNESISKLYQLYHKSKMSFDKGILIARKLCRTKIAVKIN